MRKQLARWNMATLRGQFARFATDDEGAALVEYGMLVGLIAAVCIGAVTLLGAQVNAIFGIITGALAAIPGV